MSRSVSPTENDGQKQLEIVAKQFIKYGQPIFIKDIHVGVGGYSTGEHSKCFNTEENVIISEKSDVERLLQQIQLLVDSAEFQHVSDFCSPEKVLKPIFENHITRLLTHEFYFYTKTPLSVDDYQKIVEGIVRVAQEKPKNLHLLLSSFAVVRDGALFNIAMYVTCGQKVTINAFCKDNVSNVDLSYAGLKIFPKNNVETKDAFLWFQKQDIVGKSNVANYSFGQDLFLVPIKDMRFNQCVEICVDHLDERARSSIKHQLNLDVIQFIPPHVDHLVTSNSVPVNYDNRVASNVTHIDPMQIHISISTGMASQVALKHNHFGLHSNMYFFAEKQMSFMREEFDAGRRDRNRIYFSKHLNIELNETSMRFAIQAAIADESWDTINFLLSISPRSLIEMFSGRLIRSYEHLNLYAKVLFFRFASLDNESVQRIIFFKINDDELEIVKTLIERGVALPKRVVAHLVDIYAKCLDYEWLYKLSLIHAFKPHERQYVELHAVLIPKMSNLIHWFGDGLSQILSRHASHIAEITAYINTVDGLSRSLVVTLNEPYLGYMSGWEAIVSISPSSLPLLFTVEDPDDNRLKSLGDALLIKGESGYILLEHMIKSKSDGLDLFILAMTQKPAFIPYFAKALAMMTTGNDSGWQSIVNKHPHFLECIIERLMFLGSPYIRNGLSEVLSIRDMNGESILMRIAKCGEYHVAKLVNDVVGSAYSKIELWEALISISITGQACDLVVLWNKFSRSLFESVIEIFNANDLIDHICSQWSAFKALSDDYAQILVFVLDKLPAKNDIDGFPNLNPEMFDKVSKVLNSVTLNLYTQSGLPIPRNISARKKIGSTLLKHKLAQDEASFLLKSPNEVVPSDKNNLHITPAAFFGNTYMLPAQALSQSGRESPDFTDSLDPSCYSNASSQNNVNVGMP